MQKPADANWKEFPRDLADRCVKCAQCLPACPTWQVSHDEAESPRGRIALMCAVADGTVTAEPEVLRHLDQCLRCGHCEAVCPAEVPYLALAEAASAGTAVGARAPRTARLLRRLVAHPRTFARIVAPLLRAASWLPWRHSLLTPRAAPAPRTGTYAPLSGANGETAFLFVGCVARATDGDTLSAALRALRLAGYEVRIPAQACCGALHRHAGEPAVAARLDAANAAAFAGDGPIVSCASGCAVSLRAQPALGVRVVDVSTLLARTEAPRPVNTATVLHTPCTLHVAAEGDGPARLLPGARALPARGRCCGAAGEYLLREPTLAVRLRDAVLDELGDAATLCTSNPGCAMHLRAGLAARGRRTAVRHPVLEWLDGDDASR